MSDDFEDLVKRWLRDRGATDRSAIEAMAGHVAVLPPRRRRQTGPLATAAAVIVAIGVAAFAFAPRQGSVTSRPSSPVPPDPAAFAGDSRLARCGATVETALDVFEMTRARDYQLHLPAMLLAPELDVDVPGFVVVYRDMQPFPVLGAPPPSGQTWPPRSLTPGHHDVCILVGADPASTELNVYDDVDIAGLAATVLQPNPASSSTKASYSTATSDSSFSPTPEPAPAWTADLAGQLGCDGPMASIGGEVSDGIARDVIGATSGEAVAAFLAQPSPYGGLPIRGFMELHLDAHWATYGHLVDGRIRAILVTSDLAQGRDPGWAVVGLRACDPSEFDPSIPLTYAITIWTDSSGSRVPTTVIFSAPGPGHCMWESATFLMLGKVTYLRDPEGLSGYWTKPRFDSTATLPPNAQDSGYRSGGGALWIVPGGDAYLVYIDHGERWPRLDPSVGCT